MNKKVTIKIISALILLYSHSIYADTNVSGVISANTTWTLANSPYIVVGNVGVASGVTLTIEPGVVIKYAGAYVFLVKGTIIANGTVSNPITFMSTTPGTSSGATMLKFEGTNLSLSQLSYLKMYDASKSIMVGHGGGAFDPGDPCTGTLLASYIEIKNAEIRTGGYQTSAKLILNKAKITSTTIIGQYPPSEPIEIYDSEISNSRIWSDSYNYGITIVSSTIVSSTIRNSQLLLGWDANFKFINTTVINSPMKEGGGSPVNGPVQISGSNFINSPINLPFCQFMIYNSVFSYNSTPGVRFGNGTIEKSMFVGNSSGIGIEITGYNGYNIGGSVNISSSAIKNNQTGIKFTGANIVNISSTNFFNNNSYNIENRTPKNISATNNYWDTTDTAIINEKIFDGNDDINYGLVNYTPFATGPIENTRPFPTGVPVIINSTNNYVASATLNFTWEPAVDDIGVTGYNVYVSSDNGPYGDANFVTSTNFTVNGIDGHAYKIKVEGLDSIGAGLPIESEVYIIDLTPPPAVTTLVATTQAAGNIHLSWVAVTDIGAGTSYYNIYRSLATGVLGTKIASVTGTSYVDSGTGLTDGVTYYYTVTAVDLVGNEQLSGNNQASAICDKSAYAPTVTSLSHPDQDVWYAIDTATFSWTPPADVSGIVGYYYNFTNYVSTPNPTIDNYITAISTSITKISDGVWYFNIISKDAIGNYGTTVTSYRIKVDKSPPGPPGTPQDIGVYSSSTTITWTWSPANDPQSGIAGYYISIGTTSAATEVLDDFWIGNVTYYTQPNLQDRFTYYAKVKAKNTAGLVGNYSAVSDGIKIDLTPPNAPSLVNDGTGSDIDATFSTIELSANWNTGGDEESGIKGYWYAIGTTPSNTDIRNWTYTGNVLSITASALNLNIGTTYYFLIRAENGAGLLSNITSSNGVNIRSSVLDHYEVTAPLNVVAGTNFTITINAKNITGDTLPTYSGNVTIQAVLAGNESFIGTGVLGVTSANLANGTVTVNYQTYTKAEDIRIKVIDGNGRTGLSDVVSVSAGVASNLDVAANPGSIISGQSSLVTVVVTDIYGNPVANRLVTFEVVKGNGTLSNSTSTTDSKGKATVTFTQNLAQAEVNTIRVTAGSLYSQVNINVAVLISAGSGGTIVASEDPNTKVTIPPNAVIVDVQVFIRLLDDLNDEEKQKVDQANKKITKGRVISAIVRALNALKSDGSEYGSFTDFVTIEIPYIDNNNDGIVDGTDISVDELKMLCLNENTNKWEVVADGGVNTVDKNKKVVKAEVKHFSVYTIGSTLATTLENVVVYPNPVDFSKSVRGTVKFEGLTKNSTIKIFDITGRLVKTLNPGTTENDGISGKVEWNGKNESNEEIGIGIYIYFISDPEGHKRSGKIAVIK